MTRLLSVGFSAVLGDGKFSQVEHGDQPAGKTEYGSGGPRSNTPRMPPQAGQAAGDPAGGVNQQVTPAIKDPLRQQAQVPQTPHVEKDVDDPDVNIIRGQHPPGLRSERQRGKVRAPRHQLHGRRRQGRHSRKHHGEKDEDIDTDDHLSQVKRRAAPHAVAGATPSLEGDNETCIGEAVAAQGTSISFRRGRQFATAAHTIRHEISRHL